MNIYVSIERSKNEFTHSDAKGVFKVTKLAKWGNTSRREDRPTMFFPIDAPDGSDCYPIAPDGNDGRWRIGKEKMNILEENNLIHWEKKKDKWIPYEKEYFSGQVKKIKDRSILYDVAETGDGSNILTEIFKQKDIFLNPKPIEVLIKIFNNVTFSTSTILDFFAGSGTTGHAVLKLNAEDGGHRRFILCTNNENNICRDITYQRLKTVITGKRKDGSVYSDGMSGSLKYFKVDFVPVDDQMYYEYADQLLENIRTLVELENAADMDNNKSVSIIMDDDELDDFISSIELHSECKSLYLSHDILISKDQEQKLHKNGIEIKTVPEYYYPDTESRGSNEY